MELEFFLCERHAGRENAVEKLGVDFHQTADGIDAEDARGAAQIVLRQHTLGANAAGEQIGATDAPEQSAGDGRRIEASVQFQDDVAAGAFRQFPLGVDVEDIEDIPLRNTGAVCRVPRATG